MSPTLRFSACLLPVLLSAACGGDEITLNTVNTAPVAEILSPGDDAEPFALGEVITFDGIVNDGQDRSENLLASWTSSIDGVLNDEQPSTTGRVQFATNALSVGAHVITLQAMDNAGEVGEDYTTLLVTRSNDGPTIRIDYPGNGETFTADTPLTFTATASDPDAEDAPEDLGIMWSSDLDGQLCNDAPDSDGLVRCDVLGLGLGQHVVSVVVTDSGGAQGSDQVVLDVVEPDEAPEAMIITPTTGARLLDTNMVFSGQVADDNDRADTLDIAWSSDLDGAFNWDPADSIGNLSFNTSLSPGTHRITLTATDSAGQIGTDSIQISALDDGDWDADGDGWTPNQGDCDDEDGTRSPGTVETCNDQDDDCDGVINEGLGDSYESNDAYPGTDLGSMDGDGYCTYILGRISGDADVQALSGTIHSPDDVDVFTFDTTDDWYDCLDESGYGIQIALTNIPAGHDYALELRWVSGGNAVVAASNNAGNASESMSYSGTYGFASDADDGGEYAIYVYPTASSAFGCSGAYSLTVTVW